MSSSYSAEEDVPQIICSRGHQTEFGKRLCTLCNTQLNYLGTYGREAMSRAVAYAQGIELLKMENLIVGIGDLAIKAVARTAELSRDNIQWLGISAKEFSGRDSYADRIYVPGSSDNQEQLIARDKAVEEDPRLLDWLKKRGLHLYKKIFILTDLGSGTESGIAWGLLNLTSSWQMRRLLIAFLPAAPEAPLYKYNAYLTLGRILRGEKSLEGLIVIQRDILTGYRAIDAVGSPLSESQVIGLVLKYMMEIERSDGFSKLTALSPTFHFSPALAFFHDIEIYGNLTNVFESAIVRPLSYVQPGGVTSCICVIEGDDKLVANAENEFSVWCDRTFENLRSTYLVKSNHDHGVSVGVLHVALFLGGYNLEEALRTISQGFKEFRDFSSRSVKPESLTPGEELDAIQQSVNRYLSRSEERPQE